MPLVEIAAECGLEWGTSLSALFRRETGMTPRQYRQIQRKDLPAPEREDTSDADE